MARLVLLVAGQAGAMQNFNYPLAALSCADIAADILMYMKIR